MAKQSLVRMVECHDLHHRRLSRNRHLKTAKSPVRSGQGILCFAALLILQMHKRLRQQVSNLFRLAALGTFPSIGEGDKTHSFHRIFEVSTVPRDYWASPTHQPRCCGGGSKGDRHLREVRCACPPLVPFLVTFCGTTKSNCPRGMSAS